MTDKTAQALWQNYQFLTKEMLKFLTQQDMEIFYDLLNQREGLQTILDQTAQDGFKASSAGQSLLSEIEQDNQTIMDHLQLRLSTSKRHHQVSEAYNRVSTELVSRNWTR